ncbi:type II toxin-antitoxin system PemK/MazF family toxin [Streptomyces sp. 8N706]|uniref:type II toxin-antitoxin system PemK/MazF family toxin n=1 Tax=Streptomyces sp. 8N706 TaxID=3457416 RepID=UPI003FD33E4C
MDASWWPALGAVVALALIATLVDGWARGHRRRPPRRPGRPTRGPGRPAGRPGHQAKPTRLGERPRPGEIWWADVPYEDGPGSKDRPCLVLSVRRGTVRVAKITSKLHDERTGVIPLPAGAVGDARDRQSFLETDELREVPLAEFRRRAGTLDRSVWSQVRHLIP